MNNSVENECNGLERAIEKKDDLCNFLNEYDINLFTKLDDGYDFLDEDALMLVVNNPYCDNALEIELSGEFTVFFAGWHAHYFPYKEDYEEMKKDIKAILNDDVGALVVDTPRGGVCDSLYYDDVFPYTDVIKIVRKYIHNEEIADKFIKSGGTIKFEYWNPQNTLTFDIPGVGENKKRTFPRRGRARFVIQDGESIGSGGYIIHNETTACLTYIYVEPSDKYDEKEVYEELYQVLEDDIIKDGCKKIVTILYMDYEFYKKKGYVKRKRHSMNKYIKRYWNCIIYNGIFEKNL
ncbi:hypothetical protein [Selenomonas ruminantium]|uniref:Uncharacterized protein n=1 Tax=Selenomonas ruminantium TaxID=971 RepID=A0A1H3WB97_SELRU|nr:hypothetical protein [Selenomonas ruminantium]SDZ83694.1 hypothetical protein SAMN05660648_00806 [Selenomonas ruminantium]